MISSETETNSSFNRWDIPVKFGLLIGLIGIVLTTVNFMFVLRSSYVAFLACSGVFFVVHLFLYYYTGVRQRKAMGGYISLKEAFSAIFIAILISTIISTIWGLVYAKLIDPESTSIVKEGTLAMLEKANMSTADIDKKAQDFDEIAAKSTQPKVLLLSLAQSLVITSIFGFICALIVRREPKTEMR